MALAPTDKDGMQDLWTVLYRAVMDRIQPLPMREIPDTLDSIGVPPLTDPTAGENQTKRQYIESRLVLLTKQQLLTVSNRFLSNDVSSHLPADLRYEFEELCWIESPSVKINKRTRYGIAHALEDIPLYLKADVFINWVSRLWNRLRPFEFMNTSIHYGLVAEVQQHVVNNPDDWTVEYLFDQLGAFDASDRRFALFIESLASPDIRPDEASQRKFVAAVNSVTSDICVELREVGEEGGFPVFRFTATGQGAGKAKNLIFASKRKPDLRFRDAVNNDIEIVTNAQHVLVFDQPIPSHGLRWSDLQKWWAETQQLTDKEAKTTLFKRLMSSLPDESPPQKLLFKEFYSHFGKDVPNLPALLPEVWLHWDPKTVRERGPEALTRFRMDFLLLLPNEIRIVIEVDGQQHYTDKNGRGSTDRYAKMVRADRELKLVGYEVYHFGAAELDQTHGSKLVGDFFDSLFKRYSLIR